MKHRYAFLLLVLVLPALLSSQVLRLRPYDGTPSSYLNAQIAADTLTGGLIPAGRIYELQRGAPYLANAIFRVNVGQTLRIRANDSAGVGRPVIFLYPTGTGANPQNPPGNWIDLRGNLEVKNIILSGYFEPVDSNLNNLQGGLISVPTAGAGATIVFDGCLVSNSNGNHIRTDGATKNITITNCVFANMGFLGRSNLGAGKGVDLRDASHDTVIVENSTFVNWQDRILRHYNFSNPLAGTGPIHYLRFNHNTLVNGMSYHGLLSLGSMGKYAFITNNLLMDPFSLGNDTDVTRQAEFVNSGEKDPYGGARMNWVFTTPNDTTIWKISNNYYAVSDSGQAFYNQFASAGVTGEGAPLTWHINSRLGADSATAFVKLTNFTLPNTPRVMTVLNRWYRAPNGGNKTKNTPSVLWNRSFDFDRRGYAYFVDTLNCTYSTGSAAYTGGKGGYPVGDLNWFPAAKATWSYIGDVTGVEDESPLAPMEFSLSQNYPNPFNPATVISYQLSAARAVDLRVFDMLGREVAVLAQGVQSAGTYKVNFDASNLASGFYVYRLTAGGFTQSMKMLLMK